jgi:hypothetical protein
MNGIAGSDRDGQLNPIRRRDTRGHAILRVAFEPVKSSKIGDLATRWDIVLGSSPVP